MKSQHHACTVRNASIIVTLCCALAICLGIAGRLGIRVNLTGSIPVGIYHVVSDPSALRHGDIVLVCLPDSIAHLAHTRGYVPGGGTCAEMTAPVGKLVMALPGDTVVVAPVGLSVNGRSVARSKPLDHDRNGRLLPRVPLGRIVVTRDSLWLIGQSSHSFDSRYIGPVPAANVVARVRRF